MNTDLISAMDPVEEEIKAVAEPDFEPTVAYNMQEAALKTEFFKTRGLMLKSLAKLSRPARVVYLKAVKRLLVERIEDLIDEKEQSESLLVRPSALVKLK